MTNETKKAVVVAVAKTIKGTSFLGIRAYENAKGEVSNYLLIAGYSHENAMQHDFDALKVNQPMVKETLLKEHSIELIEQAYAKVYESLEKRLSSDAVKELLRLQGDQTIKQSDAQNEAYEFLAKGVRLHTATNEVHIIGLEVKKEVIKPIEYKATKSAELTIVQNKIKKLCNFRESKIRTFKFNKAEVKIQGITI